MTYADTCDDQQGHYGVLPDARLDRRPPNRGGGGLAAATEMRERDDREGLDEKDSGRSPARGGGIDKDQCGGQ